MRIRNEVAADGAAIEAVTVAAFKDAPHASHTEQFIVRELRKAGALTVSLVAEDGGDIVGHVAVSPVTISDGTEGWYGLGPVSVLPAHQHRRIGRQLIGHALQRLFAAGAAGCVVLGDPRYYALFGFTWQPSLALPNVPVQYFQMLAFKLPSPAGVASYHEAFAATR